MTTAPHHPAATPDIASVDAQLHARNLRSAAVIAGVLDAGLLNHAGHPSKLPAAMFPDVPEDAVQAIWNLALVVGIWAGKALLRPQWEPQTLDRFRTALDEVGYVAMAASVNTAAQCGRRHQQPAEDEMLVWGEGE